MQLEIRSVVSALQSTEVEIKQVKEEIQVIGGVLATAECNIGAIMPIPIAHRTQDQIESLAYWMNEKSQLRSEKLQLMNKESQLMNKESELRSEKLQLMNKESQLRIVDASLGLFRWMCMC